MLQTEDDVALAVKDAKGALAISGGGTRQIGRPIVGEAISLAGVSGVTLYEPGALTLVAKTGTPVAEIETMLAAENQRLAFEPIDHRSSLGTKGVPTIGGVVATNASGPRRISVGACRDFLLGVRYIDGVGNVVKNGGRVMKNVTGYDLVKLMAGSYGTLGVMTEVSLKVLPDVETAATLRFQGLTLASSIALMSRALGSPYEVTGAARSADDTYLRIEGFAGSVSYRTDTLQTLLAQYGTAEVITDPAAHSTIWRGIRDVDLFSGHDTVWRISLRPSHAANFVARAQDTGDLDCSLDWGGGLIWMASKGGDAQAMHHKLQQLASETQGHATLIKGPVALRADVSSFQPEPAALATISQGLRARFDPRGILNNGLMT